MKPLFVFLLLLGFFFSPAVFAAETTYLATMNGIDCADCKRTISRSLGKMKGVKTIRIAEIGKEKHRLTIVTDGSAPLTKEAAVKALGKNAPHYEITSWSKAG